MEETATHNTKVSDSAYSSSCNSQSQRSSGSSKSRHSNSSGSSSGYCGHPSTLSSGNEAFPLPTISKRNKKKKQKTCTTSSTSSTPAPEAIPSCSSQSVSVSTSDNITRSDCSIASSNNVALGGSGALGVGLGGATIPGPENEALQNATMSQTLTSNQKLKSMELPEVIPEETESQTTPVLTPTADKNEEQMPTSLQSDQNIQDPVEFCAIVSMHDGVVMHTSASLGEVLGFPKDMWLGRSFIDFVHASDRVAFASHITSGVGTPFTTDADTAGQSNNKNSFFCRVRCYRGLKSSGFGVVEKKVTHLPFHLTLAFREIDRTPTLSKEGFGQTILLVITAKLVQSVYKIAEETIVSPKFVTKHLPSCELNHVDPEMVPYFGYLPQDMINHSAMEFYHPEDLPFIKEVYEGVMNETGSLFRSKPYRFRTQNGGYVLLETEWSSFINPWSRKLEFVIGQHRVLKGPANPDVFAPAREEDTQISEEVLKESKIIEEEIKSLLLKPISRPTETARQQVSKRCKDLANFMVTLMDEITKPKLKLDLQQEETSFSERDSVMLGEISPHHDYCDSKWSSETPPSYNQLNYNENIQRFFESKPKTTDSDESGESKTEANQSNQSTQSLPSTDEEGKSVPVGNSSLGSTTATNRKCSSPVNSSGSGSGSGCSGSGGVMGSAGSHADTLHTNTNSNRSYRPHHLTEALLYRHNEDMEKRMVQKHREQRSKGSDRESKMKKCAHEKFQQYQGLKRSGSYSWECEPFKVSKHNHADVDICPKATLPGGIPTAGVDTSVPYKQYSVAAAPGNISSVCQGSGNVNLWPPFSVSVTPFNHAQSSSNPGGYSNDAHPPHFANMFPVYYIPSQPNQQPGLVQAGLQSQGHPGPPRMTTQLPVISQQIPYINGIPGLTYYPIHSIYGGPVVYPSMAMLQPTTQQSATPANVHRPENVEVAYSGMTKFRGPASQTKSVRAELGSAMGSIASASIKRCLSECSKNELGIFSPGGRTSPDVSQDDRKPKASDERLYENTYSVMRDTEDDSCFSSFYSFLKSEKSDDSISGREDEDMVWEKVDNHLHTGCSADRARPVLREPPWLEHVTVTPDLIYRYQLNERSLEDILEADRKVLTSTQQPVLVNDQLSQFYVDMELEGLTTKLMLEEGMTTSSSSGEDSPDTRVRQPLHKSKKKRRSVEYGKITMIFEENAPLPPPAVNH